jgi:Zn-finger nucleic acid-binding protein
LKNSESRITKSEVGVVCPKCKARITISPEQLKNDETFFCPQCYAKYNLAPLRKSLQDVLEGRWRNLPNYTCEHTVTCPKCDTKIPISDEQLQNEDSYSCPRCGAIYDMATLRKGMQDAREYKKSEYGFNGAGREQAYRQTGRLSSPESDPDYYYKQFQPLWKLASFWMIISFGFLVPAAILIVVFGLNTPYFWYLFFPLIFICIAIGLYLGFKVRCPRCGYYLIGAWHRGFWPLTGICPGCGIRLKNRVASERTVMIIRIALIIVVIACLVGLVYRLLHPA